MQRQATRESWLPVAIIFLIAATPLLYVLSYAPFLRYKYGADPPPPPPGVFVSWDDSDYRHTAFKPVEWLIDETPLWKPLMAWCGLWQVGGRAEFEMVWRELEEDIDKWLEQEFRAHQSAI